MAWTKYGIHHVVLTGLIYVAILLAFAPIWSSCSFRPLFFLPILFLAQITHTSTPWLFWWTGIVWDTLAFWPIGISCLFYILGNFSWPFWHRLVMSSYMMWGVFCIWSLVMYMGPLVYMSLLTGAPFSMKSLVDVAITALFFPVCVYLWPFGNNP